MSIIWFFSTRVALEIPQVRNNLIDIEFQIVDNKTVIFNPEIP
jgi:hypothetical protein